MVLTSIALFVLLIPTNPVLDDDIYRYAWDGRVTLERGHPYGIAPSDYRLLHVRDDNFSKIGFRDVPTVYPPLAEILFAVAATTGRAAPYVIKFFLLAADIAILLLLSRTIQAREISPWWLALYALNPLVMKEFANSGHIDLVGIALLCAAMFGAKTPHQRFGLAIMAALIKPIALLSLPPLFRDLSVRARCVWGTLVIIVIAIAAFNIKTGMPAFATRWIFFPLLFDPLDRIAHLVGLSENISRVVAILVPIATLAVAWRKKWNAETTWERAFVAWILFSPVVNPWYVAWGIPIFVAKRRMYGALICAMAPLSYLYYVDESPPLLAQYVTACFFLLTLAFEFRTKLRNFSHP